MNYPIETFYNSDERFDERFDVYFSDHRLYGKINGDPLTNDELINEINSLDEVDTIRLIKACGGPKRFKHAYRKLLWESPVKILDRELRENNSSLEEYLELSYRAGLNPLPALRSRGIVVRFGGQNTISPHFTNEDIIVCLNESYVTILFNPWNRDTFANIVNKGLQFKIKIAVGGIERKYYSPIRTRENRRYRKLLKRLKEEYLSEHNTD